MSSRLSKNNRILIIVIGFITILSLMAAAVFISKALLQKNALRIESIVNENIAKQEMLSTMATSIRTRMLLVYDMIHNDDPFEIDEMVILFRQQAVLFISSRNQLYETGLTDQQFTKLEEQKKTLTIASEILNYTVEQIINEEENITLDDIQKSREINQSIIDDLNKIYQQQTKIANQQLTATREANHSSSILVNWLTATAVLLSLATMIFIIVHINRQDRLLQKALLDLKQHNENLSQLVEKRTQELLTTQQENMRMSAEIDVSRHIQEIMLPSIKELKQIKKLDISIFMEPADEVGGDYIDILPYADKRVLISIGDVTGHGLESGLIMIMAQSMVRHQSNISLVDLSRVIAGLNTSLYQNIERMQNSKNLTLCLLDYQEKTLESGEVYGDIKISGQHESLMIIREQKMIEMIETDELGLPVGMIDNIDEYCSEIKITLNRGDTLILYTDGITEAANAHEELYGLERFQQSCLAAAGHSSEQIRDTIITDVKKFIGEKSLYDDISLIVVSQK